jgi:superfamily I DNA and RNA helicase
MFSEEYGLNQDIKIGKIDDLPVLAIGQHIVWRNVEEEKWEYNIYSAFQRLKKENYKASDIVILMPSHNTGRQCVKMFLEKNIEVNHVFEMNNEINFQARKKSFWMGDGRLKICTIHSFKGWELLNIVLYIPKKAPESNKKLDAVVYTAMTRTRENLIVINANARYNEFGSHYPDKYNPL